MRFVRDGQQPCCSYAPEPQTLFSALGAMSSSQLRELDILQKRFEEGLEVTPIRVFQPRVKKIRAAPPTALRFPPPLVAAPHFSYPPLAAAPCFSLPAAPSFPLAAAPSFPLAAAPSFSPESARTPPPFPLGDARTPPPSPAPPPPAGGEPTISEMIGRMTRDELSHFMCRQSELEATLLPNPWLCKVTKKEEEVVEEEEEDRCFSPRTLGQSLDEMYEAYIAPPPTRFFETRRDCFGSGFM